MEKRSPENLLLQNRIPFLVVLTFSYLAGILICIFFRELLFPILCATGMILALIVVVTQRFISCTLLLIFGTLGYLNTSLRLPDSKHIVNKELEDKYVIGKVTSAIQKTKSGYYRYTLETQALIRDSLEHANGSILVYSSANEAELPEYNDLIVIKSRLHEVTPPQNPNEFNFKRYLSFHDTYHQTFSSSTDIKIVKTASFSLQKTAFKFRDFLHKHLITNIDSKREEQTLSALLLGKRDELTSTTINDFSKAGAMHVLAVSGLHVGILMLIIQYCFRWVTKRKEAGRAESLITLAVIWIFAFVTGLSPSVLRASIMFSFLLSGGLLNKKTSIHLSLSAAALVMTCYNPFIITEVGFQLSFCAVLGISFFTPSLLSLFPQPQNKIVKWIISISCVSLAAQLATFPIALLYFHQFPTYFIFSNLLIIPTAFATLISGIAKVIFSFIPWADYLLAKCCFGLAWILNEVPHQIASFPFSSINEIDVSIPETYVLYGLIVSLFSLLIQKKNYSIFPAFFFLLCLCGFNISENKLVNNQHYLQVYQVKNTTAFDIVTGKKHKFISTPSMIQNQDKMMYHIHHHWYNRNLHPPSIDTLHKNVNVYRVPNHTITAISSPIKLISKTISDIIIVSNNSMTLEEINDQFIYKNIIYDSSNKKDFLSCIRNSPLCTKNVHIVSEQGSIQLTL